LPSACCLPRVSSFLQREFSGSMMLVFAGSDNKPKNLRQTFFVGQNFDYMLKIKKYYKFLTVAHFSKPHTFFGL
jgi:hypothetical protein